MTPRALADALEAELRALSTPERAEQEKRYLKSDLQHLGARVPDVRRVVRASLRARPELDRAAVVALVEALWAPPIFERREAAAEVLHAKRRLLLPEDAALLERLLRASRTWALVDTLSTNVVADLAARHELGAVLDRWATDEDFWLRRAAMLALLPGLRANAPKPSGDFSRFTRYADAMLEEKEFFIRKAIGWILRDAGRRTPGRVSRWLLPRAGRAAGLTVREAVKHLPQADRAAILDAHAQGKRAPRRRA